MDKNVYAAIAMAIYVYSGNNVHDTEPPPQRKRRTNYPTSP